MWRQYIVLRDRSGRTAQGFVKLFYTHQACNISASLSRIQRGAYTLYIWDGDRLRQWEMRHNGRELRLQVKTELQNTRIEAAIADRDGRLAAVGESCGPRADWARMQARIQKESGAGRQAQPTPSAPQMRIPEKEKKADSRAQLTAGETTKEYTFPLAPETGESATLRAQQEGADKWHEPTLQRGEREEQAEPLIETLLQQAQPMQQAPAEMTAQPVLDIEEISRMIHQELQGQDTEARDPVVIATEHNHSEASAEQWTQQISEAIAEPAQRPEEVEAKENAEEEKSLAEPLVEKQATTGPEQAPAMETEQLRAPQGKELPMSETQESPMEEEVEGPSLGGEYAGQWKWKRVEAPGRYGYYLLGCVERKGVSIAMAVAVPGEYAPQPPAYLQGFSIYRDGYWVLAQDGETGRTLTV